MQSVGKRFEQDFVKSVPDYVGVIRMPDAAQSFFRNSNLRFSNKNPYDYLLWNAKGLTLYALELKTVKGKSISFERTKDENGEIHYHQIVGLRDFEKVGGCVCGLIIEFRELETTVFIPIQEFLKLQEAIPKKSFNFNDLTTYNVNYKTISQSIKKTHYRYDIESFLNETALHGGMEVKSE